ncbi:MAG: short-chain dehydrogenase/reductase [Symbiobacteriaceae bacterium]|nr:short-chain dehydrogenase/reductase [Symbiobacteriaceae bacterium]
MMDFTGRVALVTGGSGGIGRAISTLMARQGADVIIHYLRNRRGAEEVAEEVSRLGRRAATVGGNLTDDATYQALAETVSQFGGLDFLISNAATGVIRPMEELTYRHFRWVTDVNTWATLRLVQVLLPHMKGRDGRVVAITSDGGTRAVPDYTLVGIAKGGLESLVRHLVVDLGPLGITVNAVCPGIVETKGIATWPEREHLLEKNRRYTPNGRAVQPDDVAGVVALLCSPLAAMVQGQTIKVDGGYHLVV